MADAWRHKLDMAQCWSSPGGTTTAPSIAEPPVRMRLDARQLGERGGASTAARVENQHQRGESAGRARLLVAGHAAGAAAAMPGATW